MSSHRAMRENMAPSQEPLGLFWPGDCCAMSALGSSKKNLIATLGGLPANVASNSACIFLSSGRSSVKAVPECPALPVRPTRCTYL